MKKKRVVYERKDVINRVSELTGIPRYKVKEVITGLEVAMDEYMISPKEDEEVHVYLLKGVTLKTVYQPETQQVNRFTGEWITVSPRYKPRVYLSDNAKKKAVGYLDRLKAKQMMESSEDDMTD